MDQLKLKLSQYPDWDKETQIKRNRRPLEKLERRRKLRLQITDKEEQERTEFLEDFKQLIDSFRPRRAKLYSRHLQ